MRAVGIVAEYNPFHNGHRFMIEQVRQLGATHVVAAMSGSFVQRGEAAFADKFLRAEAAVRSGADLVLDLPVPWSLGGAATFARGGVSILLNIGCDALAFGCESDDVALLREAARLLMDPSVLDETACKMKQGMTYPSALNQVLIETGNSSSALLLQKPNNTLAVEYMKAMYHKGADLPLVPVLRSGCAHDAPGKKGRIASAAALREMRDFAAAAAYMPQEAFRVYADNPGRILDRNHYETAVLTALRLLPDTAFALFVDDSSGLKDRLLRAVKTASGLEELFQTAKTKNVTLAKVRREVMHLFLQIPPDFAKAEPLFVRVLAANERGLEVLSKANSQISLLTKHAEASALSPAAKELYELQCRASDLYALCCKTKRACCTEQTSSIQIIRSVPQEPRHL